MSTQVITISNRRPHESYYHLEAFEESARRQGITPHFLQEGPYRGLMSKPKHLKAYLDREGSKFEHVVVVDSWDVLFLTGLDDILYNYKAFGECVIFNTERSCFPRADLANSPQFSCESPYRYLNSGFIMGPTDLVIQMLNEMNLESIPDDSKNERGEWLCHNDQTFYMLWYLGDSKVPRKLDISGILCQSLHDAGPDEFAYLPDTKRVISLLTKNQPCAVHGNGTGKEWLKRIIQWIGL